MKFKNPMNLQLFIPILTATLMCFNGCGDSSKSKIISDDDCSNSSVSNAGEPQNSRGYYGDEVCFGGKKIVGKWELYCHYNGMHFAPPCNTQFDQIEYIDLKSDGTTQQYNLDGTLFEYPGSYGSDELGIRFNINYLSYSGGESLYFTYLETNSSYPNCLLTKYESFHLMLGSTITYDKYWLCKVDE